VLRIAWSVVSASPDCPGEHGTRTTHYEKL
jgi:hypothetical protein